MQQKTCVITGANSGIGLATAKALAARGAEVVMICRSRERGEEARNAIVGETKQARVGLLIADLSSQQSIREAARSLTEQYGKLDVLINNAGGLFAKHETSPDGFEMTFAVNYLAPFLLTHLLLDPLQSSGTGRIVNVASIMQAPRLDPEAAAHPVQYNSFRAYKEAKLALIMMTYYLAGQLSDRGMTVNALHPGAIYTSQSSKSMPVFLRPLLKLLMSSPEQGAKLPLYLASSAEAAAANGQYFKGSKAVRTVPVSYDTSLQRELYEKSLRWTGLAED